VQQDSCDSYVKLKLQTLGDGLMNTVRFRSGQNRINMHRLLMIAAANRTEEISDCSEGKYAALPGEDVFAASNEALANDLLDTFYFVTGGARSRLAYNDHFDLDGAFCSNTPEFVNLPSAE